MNRAHNASQAMSSIKRVQDELEQHKHGPHLRNADSWRGMKI